MESIEHIIKGASLFIMSAFVTTASLAQSKAERDSTKTEVVKQLMENRNFVFKVNSASPQSGSFVPLTPYYDMVIAGDSVISYLPYFGRAYSTPIDPTRGALDFISTKNELTIIPQKNGGWEVSIKPKDNREVQQMYMSVSENGYASLRVTSTNRQPISFNGYIAEREKNKKS